MAQADPPGGLPLPLAPGGRRAPRAWVGLSAARCVMGASQQRCCSSCTDKQNQLKLPDVGGEVYTPFDIDITGSERPPGQDQADAEGHGSSECSSWGRCWAPDTGYDRTMPSTPSTLTCVKGSVKSRCVFGDTPCSSPSRVQGESTLEDTSGCLDLIVELVKANPGEDLGLKVLHRGVGVLVVSEIHPGGAVEVANRQNARAGAETLQVGDQIAMINGVGGDDAAMAEECKRAKHLTLGVRRVQQHNV
uniref:PDZ domain-containing protein n=1 Tax=Alexandrium monilatum TaxID=311494 RepID=A0A7S4PSC3_9DINO